MVQGVAGGLNFRHISAISGGWMGKELPGEHASRVEFVGIAELVVTDKNGTFPKR